MEWRAEALVLNDSSFGEADALVDVLTRDYGRYRGFVKGGQGRRIAPSLQPGNFLSVHWRSRIAENLGRFTVEPLSSPLAALLDDGVRLKALSAMVSVLVASMPERAVHPSLYDLVCSCLTVIADGRYEQIGRALVVLEMHILAELGYGLALDVCAATGSEANLAFVSPKTGRAVSLEAGMPYKGRLLPLPAFLRASYAEDTSTTIPDTGSAVPDTRAISTALAIEESRVRVAELEDALDGFRLTGYFLERNVWVASTRREPSGRARFLAHLYKLSLSAAT